MKRIVLIVSLIAAAGVVLPGAASAGVHGCPPNPQDTGYWPYNDIMAPNQVTSVRNVSCSVAGNAVNDGYITGQVNGWYTNGNLGTPGWRCVVTKHYWIRVLHQPRALMGAEVKCVRGHQAFRWTWGT
jgi:hypothetical protein